MIILVLVLVALIVLCAAALIAVNLWRAGPWGLAMLAALVALPGWSMYRAATPGPEFYRQTFRDQTGLAFPEDGRFVARAAHALVLPGDACALAVVEISAEAARRLRQSLDAPDSPPSARTIQCEDLSIDSDAYRATFDDSKDGSAFWWGVSHDGRTLALRYTMMSWM